MFRGPIRDVLIGCLCIYIPPTMKLQWQLKLCFVSLVFWETFELTSKINLQQHLEGVWVIICVSEKLCAFSLRPFMCNMLNGNKNWQISKFLVCWCPWLSFHLWALVWWYWFSVMCIFCSSTLSVFFVPWLFLMETPKCRGVSQCASSNAGQKSHVQQGFLGGTRKLQNQCLTCISVYAWLMILSLYLPFNFIVNSIVRYVEQITSFRADTPRCPEPWEAVVTLK